MSGIRTTTRLEELFKLRRRVNEEIEAEIRANPPHGAEVSRISPAVVRLAELGVTSHDVAVWADRAGVRAMAHGHVPLWLVDAYARAHPRR